jgi:hypothetical protein
LSCPGVLILGSGFITHDLSFRLKADQAEGFTNAMAQVLLVKTGDAREQALIKVMGENMSYFVTFRHACQHASLPSCTSQIGLQ